MLLNPADQQAIARRAIWYFDCFFGLNNDDSVVFTGDGIDDLDGLINRLQFAVLHNGTNIRSRFVTDIGTQYSVYRPFDLDDVRAIRQFYLDFYGNVNKPPVLDRAELPGGSAAISEN